MNNILVTGAQGFLGANLIKVLLQSDVEITALVRDTTLHDALTALNVQEDELNLITGDVENFDAMVRILSRYEIDTVFHLAASSIVSTAKKGPRQAFNTNIMGTVNLLEAARQVGTVTAFVGASSDKAYGDSDILPYTEDFPLNGLHIYPASKAAADIIMRTYYREYGLPVAVTRCANLYGQGDLNFTRIVPKTIRNIIYGDAPILYAGASEFQREFIHVNDAINAYLDIATHIEQAQGEAFNVGTGDVWSIGNLIGFIADAMGFAGPINIEGRAQDFKEISVQCLDSSKLNKLTGFISKYTIENSIASVITWYEHMYSLGRI